MSSALVGFQGKSEHFEKANVQMVTMCCTRFRGNHLSEGMGLCHMKLESNKNVLNESTGIKLIRIVKSPYPKICFRPSRQISRRVMNINWV